MVKKLGNYTEVPMKNISVDPYNFVSELNEANNSILNAKHVNVLKYPNERQVYGYYSSPNLQWHAAFIVASVPENYANPPKNNAKWKRSRIEAGVQSSQPLVVPVNHPYIGKDIRPMDEQCKSLINKMKAGSVINSGGGI